MKKPATVRPPPDLFDPITDADLEAVPRGIRVQIPADAFEELSGFCERNRMTKTDVFLAGIAAEISSFGEYGTAQRFLDAARPMRKSEPPAAPPKVFEMLGRPTRPGPRKTKSGTYSTAAWSTMPAHPKRRAG